MLSSGLRTASGKEESVANPEWNDEESRGPLTEASEQQVSHFAPSIGTAEWGFDVNVAGVRMVGQKRTLREKQHAEFMICTKRTGKDDVYVARRYGAFKKLYHDVSFCRGES